MGCPTRWPAVDQLRDVRMLQRGENLSRGTEPVQQYLAVRATPQRLDGHPLVVLRVSTFRLVPLGTPSLVAQLGMEPGARHGPFT